MTETSTIKEHLIAAHDAGEWKLNEWLKFKDYPYQDERSAYTAGYNDAWYGYAKWTSNIPDYFPAEYSDGYAMGRADRAGDQP